MADHAVMIYEDMCNHKPTLYIRGGQTCSMNELHVVKSNLQRAAT